MVIGIGSDHVGVELKQIIVTYLQEIDYEVKDYGPFNSEQTDYPKYGYSVAKDVSNGIIDSGILICGTGVGISITANKVPGIRAVVCSEPYSAKMSKQHNDTNILSFGSRVVGSELAKMITLEWLNASFEGGRHKNRTDMISAIEGRMN